jgi:sulfopyruvate decarboxylase subunit alpha
MSTEKSSGLQGSEVAAALVAAGVSHAVTVPDWVQLPLHRALEADSAVKVISCCTEHEAFMIAAGLYCGGKQSAVIIQNQGLYAGLNALRGAGLDANVPIVMLIGQFGREPGNRGEDTTKSKRRIVRMLDPLLQLLDIQIFKVDSVEDLANVKRAFDWAAEYRAPAAIVFDRNMEWDA